MVEEHTPHIFEGFGIELEYMIVDREHLNVCAIADKLLTKAAHCLTSHVEFGSFAWSNELALHVIEMKTNGPVADLSGLANGFQAQVDNMNKFLSEMGALLLPTAMHPWMDPFKETKLWPHGDQEIYAAYNRIFNCQGHGWSNLQSVHLNLGFNGDEKFGRLHAAIRLILPILPAIAASSPFVQGNFTGVMDNRLEYYRQNQSRIPSLTGAVIPEPVFTRKAYEEEILIKNYRDISPHDPEGILQDEWLNSRGAIARFQRSAIEIRLLDIQECPLADMAIIQAIVGVLRFLVEERWRTLPEQKCTGVSQLADILLHTTRDAERTIIEDRDYLAHFGITEPKLSAGDLWQTIVSQCLPDDECAKTVLDTIYRHGTLASRLLKKYGPSPSHSKLKEMCRRLAYCLSNGTTYCD